MFINGKDTEMMIPDLFFCAFVYTVSIIAAAQKEFGFFCTCAHAQTRIYCTHTHFAGSMPCACAHMHDTTCCMYTSTKYNGQQISDSKTTHAHTLWFPRVFHVDSNQPDTGRRSATDSSRVQLGLPYSCEPLSRRGKGLIEYYSL